jgi:hypothetical protein
MLNFVENLLENERGPMNDQDLTKTDYDPDRSLVLIEGLSHFLTNFLQNLASCQTSLRHFLILEEHPHEIETSHSLQFSSHIFTIIYKMNCMVYFFFIATCEPNLYLFIDSDVNFACSFYNNYKFLVAQNILCTP